MLIWPTNSAAFAAPAPCHLNRRTRCVRSARRFAWRATLIAKFLSRASYALTRRSALRLGLAGLILPRFFMPAAQAAAQETESHGLSIFGDLAQPAGFSHFPYVNPDAPKSGEIVLQVSTTS